MSKTECSDETHRYQFLKEETIEGKHVWVFYCNLCLDIKPIYKNNFVDDE